MEFFSDADTLLGLSPLFSLGCFFTLLHIEIVAKLLLELLLGSTLLLLVGQFLEDAFTNDLSLLFHLLDLILTSLLLLGVATDHFIFVLIHLRLAFQKCALLAK